VAESCNMQLSLLATSSETFGYTLVSLVHPYMFTSCWDFHTPCSAVSKVDRLKRLVAIRTETDGTETSVRDNTTQSRINGEPKCSFCLVLWAVFHFAKYSLTWLTLCVVFLSLSTWMMGQNLDIGHDRNSYQPESREHLPISFETMWTLHLKQRR